MHRLRTFMDERIYPAEPVYDAQREELSASGRPHHLPQVVEELKDDARARGLWNFFLPEVSGLSNLEYAVLAEEMGRSAHIAPEAMNCAAPDTGNMESLHLFGTPEQKARWLQPLLDGQIRSGFSMTEPAVASSDATNIETRIDREGGEYVINGRKWWTSGAADPRCAIFIVMGKTDPHAAAHRQQSMVLVPRETPGLRIVRDLKVFGYTDQHGHCEIEYRDVRVPASNLLGEEGGGFAIAQARLGPGRIHHCMRAIGMAERALDMMCERALSRTAFGKELARQGVVQEQIAESRMEIEMARLYVLKAAWMMDQVGAKKARSEISAIKVAVPRAALNVIDRAIQIHGGAGVTDDFGLASLWAHARTLRIVDGPDAVHLRSVARQELDKHVRD